MKPKKNMLWKRALTGLGLSLPLLLCLTTYSGAAEFYVDDNACPDPGTGTLVDPFCSIQYAIDQAIDGDDVLVNPGSYAEGISMKTGVNLLKALDERPVITMVAVPANHVLFKGVSNCTLNGFILDDTGREDGTGYAIVRIDGTEDTPCNNITISNCDIKGADTLADATSKASITINGEITANITGNTLRNNIKAGIAVRRGRWVLRDSTITISENTITNNGNVGIYLSAAAGDDNRISINDNTISDNKAGLRIINMSRLSLEGNEISHNNFAGISIDSSNSITPHITNNSIHHNNYAGINIMGTSNLTISDNELNRNLRGGITFWSGFFIHSAESSGNVVIATNDIHDNSLAGISVIDHISGPLTIIGNEIHHNLKAGITFFNAATAIISDNDIHNNTVAGIATGNWDGIYPPKPRTGETVRFERSNGPVHLTINRNTIHNNFAGMRIDHASGTISNNLVYANGMAGIRFSGNNIAPFEPFGVSWGITEIINNTTSDNGRAGIIYDDINNIVTDDGSLRPFNGMPTMNVDQAPRSIKNNISTWNWRTGTRDATCDTIDRDFNLYYFNLSSEDITKPRFQLGGCRPNPNEIMNDPLYVDRMTDYHLQSGSPAENAGDDGLDMGAYGGSVPLP